MIIDGATVHVDNGSVLTCSESGVAVPRRREYACIGDEWDLDAACKACARHANYYSAMGFGVGWSDADEVGAVTLHQTVRP